MKKIEHFGYNFDWAKIKIELPDLPEPTHAWQCEESNVTSLADSIEPIEWANDIQGAYVPYYQHMMQPSSSAQAPPRLPAM